LLTSIPPQIDEPVPPEAVLLVPLAVLSLVATVVWRLGEAA